MCVHNAVRIRNFWFLCCKFLMFVPWVSEISDLLAVRIRNFWHLCCEFLMFVCKERLIAFVITYLSFYIIFRIHFTSEWKNLIMACHRRHYVLCPVYYNITIYTFAGQPILGALKSERNNISFADSNATYKLVMRDINDLYFNLE